MLSKYLPYLIDLLHKSELTADFRRYTQIFYLLLVILSAFIGENLRLKSFVCYLCKRSNAIR